MAITDVKLENVFKQYKHKYEGRKEDYFAPLFLAEKFGKPLDEMMNHCSFGSNDYGIDAYFIDKETRNLYLFQFKWSENCNLFNETYDRLIKSGMERIFGNPYGDPKTNKMITKLVNEINEYKDVINKVFISFVFNGDIEKAENSKTLDYKKEELESKKFLIDKYFTDRKISFAIQYETNESKEVVQVSRTEKTHAYQLDFKSHVKQVTQSGELMYVGVISLYDLYNMYAEMKSKLFERNIRYALKDSSEPNRAISKMLKSIVEEENVHPEQFIFHHNGISMFAESLDVEEHHATVYEPRILNGAQTISSYARYYDELKKRPNSDKYDDVFRKINVICKIITNCESEFVTQVTISNNKQNPVLPWNLRANDLVQFQFEDMFSDYGIFYERQERSYHNKTRSELEEKGVIDGKIIQIKYLAQTLLAIQGEVGKIAEIKEIFENEIIYKKVFNPEFLNSDARKIILSYKIFLKLKPIINEIRNKAEVKYNFIPKAKNLVWALTIQGIFNDQKLKDKLEDHGNKMIIDADFNVYIKNIASTKVKMIISELVRMPKYSSQFKEERYDFFRSNQVFIDSMRIAKEKYGWEVKKLK